MSSWVTGVPLPGWMLSAAMTTPSLPSISTILPLRNELAMTLTASSNSFQIPAHHTDLAPDRQLFLVSPPDKDMPLKHMPH
jgi:hypothetical protein